MYNRYLNNGLRYDGEFYSHLIKEESAIPERAQAPPEPPDKFKFAEPPIEMKKQQESKGGLFESLGLGKLNIGGIFSKVTDKFKKLDKDDILILVIIYLLFTDESEGDNFDLILALGFVFLFG